VSIQSLSLYAVKLSGGIWSDSSGIASSGWAAVLTDSALSELTSGVPTAQTIPLETTYTQGFQPTAVSGAPALPNPTLTIANYPALDVVPPANSTEVQQWLSQVSVDFLLATIVRCPDGADFRST
jgi:hypothetical protein